MNDLCIYQTLHLYRGRPRLVAEHVELIDTAARALFGFGYAPDVRALEARIAERAQAWRFPAGVSAFVRLELTAAGEERLCNGGLSLYAGYALRSVAPDAVTLPYDIPIADAPTSAREALNALARQRALAAGARTAVRCGADGVLHTADDSAPLFAVRDQRVCTTPAFPPPVAQRLVLRACEAAGIETELAPLRADEAAHFDELFYADHRGITALARLDGRPLMQLLAGRVAAAMERLFA